MIIFIHYQFQITDLCQMPHGFQAAKIFFFGCNVAVGKEQYHLIPGFHQPFNTAGGTDRTTAMQQNPVSHRINPPHPAF
jgi:hypothetical protein